MIMQRNNQKVSNYLKENIVFFCKDCNEIVEVKPLGRKFVYRCSKCGTKNVAFGTAKSIKGFYRMGDDDDDDDKNEDAKPGTGAAKKAPEESRPIAVNVRKVEREDVKPPKKAT